MKISVVIPTFNRALLLKRAIYSVLSQSIFIDEIIVVDDGSNDETKNIIEKHNVKYIYQSNSGVSCARNRGINCARNDWIAFLDSDDIWHKDKISIQTEFHTNNKNILISHTDETWFYDGKVKNKKNIHKKPFGDCFLDNISFCKIAPSSVLIHKSIFEDVGYFDEKLLVCEDYDMWLRITSNYELGYVNKELVDKHSGHENQLSFSTFGLDRFRIYALLKHIDSTEHIPIKDEIIKKCNILLKGAKKFNNLEIIKEFEEIKNNIFDL